MNTKTKTLEEVQQDDDYTLAWQSEEYPEVRVFASRYPTGDVLAFHGDRVINRDTKDDTTASQSPVLFAQGYADGLAASHSSESG